LDEKAHGFGCGPFLLLVFLASSAYLLSAGSYVFVVLLGLAFAACLLAEATYRAAATRFLLLRQKKPGKEKARLAGGWSGGTHCAPASLRSNSRRKYVGHPRSGGATLARAGGFGKRSQEVLEAAFDPELPFRQDPQSCHLMMYEARRDGPTQCAGYSVCNKLAHGLDSARFSNRVALNTRGVAGFMADFSIVFLHGIYSEMRCYKTIYTFFSCQFRPHAPDMACGFVRSTLR
jgi:hypothetical protein